MTIQTDFQKSSSRGEETLTGSGTLTSTASTIGAALTNTGANKFRNDNLNVSIIASRHEKDLATANIKYNKHLNNACISAINNLTNSLTCNSVSSNNNNNNNKKLTASNANSSRKTSSTPALQSQKPIVKRSNKKGSRNDEFEETPMFQAFFTYLSYSILQLFGHIREFLRRIGVDKRKGAVDNNSKDFPPLYQSFEPFFTRNYYLRVRDVFNRPICSVPGAEIELLDRKSDDYNWTYYYTGKKIKALNMGSYNYLGFAENNGPSSKEAIKSVNEYGVATSSPRAELGTLRCHKYLETLIAKFLGVEDTIVFGMGFATNSLNIPTLIGGKQSLILSDELNHSSIILGARLSGATIRPFKHNDVHDLENKLRKAIIEGQPVTKRPWKKILILVEGVYSMEGTITPLPEIIALKKKYKAYLYLDEAHSIGAVGKTGRGIVEHYGCDHRDVDILMGTFSKSFGAAGGYLAGNKKLIEFLRQYSHASIYASSMSAPVCMQITKTLEIIMGLDGTKEGQRRIGQLAENTKYFRDKLIKMGFIVYGNPSSPVVPAMLFMPTKVAFFNRLMLERGVAVVTVGFPATNLPGGRVRFCISAAHTREMLDYALEAIDYCGHMNGVKVSKLNPAKSFKELNELDQKQNSSSSAADTKKNLQ